MALDLLFFSEDKTFHHLLRTKLVNVNLILTHNIDLLRQYELIVIDYSKVSYDKINSSLEMLLETNANPNRLFLIIDQSNLQMFEELYDNPLVYDIVFKKDSPAIVAKRFNNFVDKFLLKVNIKEFENDIGEYQQMLYQLNEIFLFEENLQLNFFDMDIFNAVQLILTKLENSLQVEACFFFRLNKEDETLILEATSSKKLKEKEIIIDIKNMSHLQHIFEHHKPIHDNNLTVRHAFYQLLTQQIGIEVKSIILVPVFKNDKVYGVIVNLNKRYSRKFNDIDLAFTQIVANKVSIVLDYKNTWQGIASAENNVVQKLNKERDELKGLLNNIEFAILIFTKKEKIYFMNQSVANVLHLQKSITDITELRDLFDDDIIGIINSQKNIASPRTIQNDFLYMLNNQYIKIGFSVSNYFINDLNEPGYIITFKDITASSNQKDNILRVDKLASLGVLASGIAHEIRNPLAGIKTMTEALSNELIDPDKLEYTQRIIRQVDRLSDLLKSLFIFAKPNRPEKQEIEIPELCKEVLKLLSGHLDGRNIKLTEVYEATLEPISIDSNQIEQVLFNVFLNAIDAMKNGGSLLVKVNHAKNLNKIVNKSRFSFSITNSRYLEISIEDTGIGMSEEVLEQVFNPFFTTRAEGTGLGLSIVHQIITEHQGIIDIDSKAFVGTQFRIFLPYN